MKSFQNTKIAKLAAIGAAFTLFGTGIGYAAGEWENIWVQFDSVNLKVNGQNITSSNLLYNDRTYVPLRACAEMLGSTVGWDQNTNTASILANTTDSAELSKAIKDMNTVGILIEKLDKIYLLGYDLYNSYIFCVEYSNDIVADFANREDSYSKSIEYFNTAIDDYNNYINFIDGIVNGGKNINIDLSKTLEAMTLYGESIDDLKSAFTKLRDYDNNNNENNFNQAEKLWESAVQKIYSGDTIIKEYRNLLYDYMQKYSK